jgi:hypothetical protein
MDATRVITKIRSHLVDYGMVARGADKTDFQFPDSREIYFRTGTSYKEVTVVPVIDEKRMVAIRILNEDQVVEALHLIDRIIATWRETA